MATNIMDRRRINGPARSVEPLYGPGAAGADPFAGGRADGRGLDQVRAIYMKTGPLSGGQHEPSESAASGSAYYEQGRVRVSCAVYGPRQGRRSNARMGVFDCEFRYAPFACSWKRRSHVRGADEKEISLMLEHAVAPAIRLEAYPKACIDAFVTVIESDGKAATIAAAINCISAALADAGIEMYDSVAACSMGLRGAQWVADCCQAEEDAAPCSMLIAHMPSADEVTYILQHGKATPEQTDQAVQTCTNMCTRVYAVICRCLQASLE
ncbi:3'-5'-exoribonuclease [Coemansia javaensis]|uniref:3'-5'-exoribonuclease n=1 Tax=Coemansia javaensis TaxID=2761396 RepID=A0A9W8H3G1_9FUNG|nr:3'-5'-exoribonuclease [Coemansia javaensis]